MSVHGLTVDQILTRVAKLWPRWQVGPEVLTEWRAALTGMNPQWVDEAVSTVYRTRSGEEPRLPHVLAEFHAISRRWREAKAAERSTGPSRADVEQAEREAWEREHAARLHALFAATPAELAEAFARHPTLANLVPEQERGDPSAWSGLAVGLVHAAITTEPGQGNEGKGVGASRGPRRQ